MMLYYLTPLNFANYGSVYELDPTDANCPTDSSWNCITGTNVLGDTYYCSDAPVYITAGSSMMVLKVRQTHKSSPLKAFYLDRTVRLDSGIAFQVSPLNGEGSYCFYVRRDATLHAHKFSEPEQECTIESRMALREIFTIFYQEKGSCFRFKGEIHRQYELVYVDVGELHNMIGPRDYILSQGDVMLITPYQWHSQFTDETHQACFVTITFDWDCKYAGLLGNQVLHLRNSQVQLLKAMIEESRSTDLLNEEFIFCYLKELLLSLIRQVHSGLPMPREQKPATVNSESTIVEDAISYLKDNICDRLTVNEIANHVNVSPSHLSVLFQKQLGISPSEYFRRCKLEKSKAMIREGKLNFTEIAEALSYSSVHHFSNQFKNTFGMSPTEYSRSLK